MATKKKVGSNGWIAFLKGLSREYRYGIAKRRPASWRRLRGQLRPNLRRPLFILGAPRSGTTFLGECLGHLPELSYHNEPHATMNAFQFVQRGLWSEGWARWYYATVYGWLMRVQRDGDLRFAEKSPRNVFLIPFLRRAFPDAQFVHILRDGRDVAVSLAEKKWLQDGVGGARRTMPIWVEPERAEEFEKADPMRRCGWAWRRFTEAALAGQATLPAENWHDLRYEELVLHPDREADRLLDFLGIHVPASRAVLHEALSDVKTSSVGRWTKLLTAEQLAEIDEEAGSLLRQLGYLPVKAAA